MLEHAPKGILRTVSISSLTNLSTSVPTPRNSSLGSTKRHVSEG